MSTKPQAIETESNQRPIGSDHPLTVENAIQGDMLDRKGFAKNVADIICRSDLERSLSISIEGAWGSGKTSVLAMISSSIKSRENSPIIVNYNPWLVGDRDSLLRSFLGKLAKEIGKIDYFGKAKKVADALESYSGVFDIIKSMPGAEPWVSILKGSGKMLGDFASGKYKNIESQKESVESALRDFKKRIVVFIDDVDRLFPSEVYEMIRIIKAVGDLPSITYVVAWDRSYIEKALDKSSVPMSASYLDKIVQVRLPVPAFSLNSKEILFSSRARSVLNPDALDEYFDGGMDRLADLMTFIGYDLMEQPRDIFRLFDLVASIEPTLRGEVVLSDIIGLSILMIKAGHVFDLIKRRPDFFVGDSSIDGGRGEGWVAQIDSESRVSGLDEALEKSSNPELIGDLVGYLFPKVMKSNKSSYRSMATRSEGFVCNKDRLLVFLMSGVYGDNASINMVRQYIKYPEARDEIKNGLSVNNCLEFMKRLGDVGVDDSFDDNHIDNLCVAISRLVDSEVFVEKSLSYREFSSRPLVVAVDSIRRLLVSRYGENCRDEVIRVSDIIVRDKNSLTVASWVLFYNYPEPKRDRFNDLSLLLKRDGIEELSRLFMGNVEESLDNGRFLSLAGPEDIMRYIYYFQKDGFYGLFERVAYDRGFADRVAETIFVECLYGGKGVKFYPSNEIELNSALYDKLKSIANQRLSDTATPPKIRAIWTCILTGEEQFLPK